ncbi:hypothetical protein C7E17_26275, partial [Stenotrophomonas maltophilia]
TSVIAKAPFMVCTARNSASLTGCGAAVPSAASPDSAPPVTAVISRHFGHREGAVHGVHRAQQRVADRLRRCCAKRS